MRKHTMAVVIPVFNVAKIIRPTLESVRWADEVILVDMFSTDDTKKISAEYPNCRLLEKKDFIYANVNYGCEQAKSEWILRLDSDEVVTPELRAELEDILNQDQIPFDGYEAQSNVYFMGYLLRHGFGNNNWRTTFFKRGFARYNAQSEHEDMIREGKWGRLKYRYDHFTNPTLSNWVQKINYYTDRDMDRWDPKSEKITMTKVLYRTLRWFQRYYLYPYQAFRDGVPGLVVALVAAAGMMIHTLKQWEKQERAKRGSNYVPPHPNA
jgi:glycosyltransferase involved in cell wall biosynthesis